MTQEAQRLLSRTEQSAVQVQRASSFSPSSSQGFSASEDSHTVEELVTIREHAKAQADKIDSVLRRFSSRSQSMSSPSWGYSSQTSDPQIRPMLAEVAESVQQLSYTVHDTIRWIDSQFERLNPQGQQQQGQQSSQQQGSYSGSQQQR